MYRPFVLAAPIEATILRTEDPVVVREASSDEFQDVYQTTATVSAGIARGLLPGMELHFMDDRYSGSGVVVEVDEHTSRVEYVYPESSMPRESPVRGLRVSTREPDLDWLFED